MKTTATFGVTNLRMSILFASGTRRASVPRQCCVTDCLHSNVLSVIIIGVLSLIIWKLSRTLGNPCPHIRDLPFLQRQLSKSDASLERAQLYTALSFGQIIKLRAGVYLLTCLGSGKVYHNFGIDTDRKHILDCAEAYRLQLCEQA